MKIAKQLLLCSVLLVACKAKTTNDNSQVDATNDVLVTNELKDVTKIDVSNIPSAIKPEGKPVIALKYYDKDGENYVIYSEILIDHEGYEFAPEGKLYYERFVNSGNGFNRVWKIYDYHEFCDFGGFIFGNFVDIQITDLDKDGYAEIWTMYETDCMGDVNPATVKLIAYNKDTKYAVRGTSKVRLEENGPTFGGEYKLGEGISGADKVFVDFAKQHFTKSVDSKINM